MSEISAILREEGLSSTPSALATILHARGSSFRRPGARLWIGTERREGSISAGCLENDLSERAQAVIESGRPFLVSYDTSSEGDILWGTSSGCGGRIDVLLEPFTDDLRSTLRMVDAELAARRRCAVAHHWQNGIVTRAIAREGGALSGDPTLGRSALSALQMGRGSMEAFADGCALTELLLPAVALTVFGAGEDARRTAALAATVGWEVEIVHRSFSRREAGIEGVRSLSTWPDRPADRRSAVLVMSHDYHQDGEALRLVLEAGHGYVGIVGPRRRTVDLLASASLPPGSIQRVHSPAGLDLGAETPAEIAVSIVAEIQAVMAGHEGGKLSDRPGPIHHATILSAHDDTVAR